MIGFIKKHLPEILLILFTITYSIYFSLLTINRNEKLYSHYFDLGIMHQTVYNTYKGITTGNFSRILELTNPHISADQVKRMSIHNDMLLGLLSPFYIFNDGPETLLVIQSIVLAVGAIYIYLLGKHIFKDLPFSKWLALLFAVSYLLYPPMQKANKYDFHAVTLATTLLLAMFYYWTQKKYKTSFVCAILALLAKEQVGMTVALFGGYVLYKQYEEFHTGSFISRKIKKVKTFIASLFKNSTLDKEKKFAYIIIASSIIWILLSMFIIIPASRGGEHFASHYYDHIKQNPFIIFTYPFKQGTWQYLADILSHIGFLSFLSPMQFLISLPELGINLLSSNGNMRNTYFHYTSLITPFVFISSMYGFVVLFEFISKRNKKNSRLTIIGISLYVIITSLLSAYLAGPLPFAKNPDVYPWLPPQQKYYEVKAWEKILDDDQIKVSTTGVLAPHFTSRQYFYDFSWKYKYAEYVVVEEHDVLYGYLKEKTVPAYNDLQKDKNYIKIYDVNGIEVYRKTHL